MGKVDYEAIEDFLEEAFPKRGCVLPNQAKSRIRTLYGSMAGWIDFSRGKSGKSYKLIYIDDNTRIFLMLDGYIIIVNDRYNLDFLSTDFSSFYNGDGYTLDSEEVENILKKITKMNNRKVIEVK